MRFGTTNRCLTAVLGVIGSFGLAACQTAPLRPTLDTASYVDVSRFMGDWYVIANIPTRIERGAHNAVESYRLAKDGRVLTTFTFRAGSFDGPAKRYNPVGFVQDNPSGAVWRMQFIWPFKADYRVIFVDADYTHTVIGREKRDYAWIMARTPIIPDAEYTSDVERLRQQGYDITRLQRVPQQSGSARAPQVR